MQNRRVLHAFIAGIVACASWSAEALRAQTTQPEPITAAVIPGWQLPDGRLVAGLALDLAPGWKTYWRAPGDAGIPPLFDWRQARNVARVTLSWPTPEVFVENGMRSIGYSGRVVLPVHIEPTTAGQTVRLRGRMDLGICADVCMPHTVRFDTFLPAGTSAPEPQIVAALAQTPFTEGEAGVTQTTCELAPTAQGMRVTVRAQMPSAGGREVSVIEPGVANVWTSEATTLRRGNWIEATSEMVHLEGAAFALNRQALRVTVIGRDYAVDIRGCRAAQ